MLTSEKNPGFVSFANEKISIDTVGKTIVKNGANKNLSKIAKTSNKHFELIIMPTEKCNFRCTYCYEDFTAGRMKPEIISAIKKLLKRRAGDLETLHISWFGGEPLVAKNIVLEISEYSKHLASQNPQLSYSGGMTTNAYLLDYQTAKALANVGVKRYQISLDGPREIHNKSRLRADGKGTYDKIWSNLLAIRDSSLPVSILLRIHFSADTFQLLDPLIEDIKKEFLPDPRFLFVFKAIGRWGGENDNAIKVLSLKKKEQAVQSLQTKLFGENIDSPQNLPDPENYVCYASRSNSLVIRSNGDVAKCTVALYDDRNKVATLQPDGTLKLIPGRIAPWLRGMETLDFDTLGCPLVKLPG
ncbi:radical SAM protein [Pleurocapsa sp. FMAR1]|uniref:radical SAM protein n=1 Tax=Pleurocapsa sp. FMAR1 TaxID=3040204 RepID=UPI0029C70DB1|nr:radical SAM protein [Pleurocapsa sp. FMAR1]